MSKMPKEDSTKYESDNEIETVEIENSLEMKRFVERQTEITDDFEYIRDRREPGLILIFNQDNFQDFKLNRKGSKKDVYELIVAFSRIGYNIEQDNIFNNYTRKDILEVLKKVVKDETLAQCNCLILIFLSHGNTDNALETSDAKIHTEEIWNLFATCDYLKDKPKLFIFQACKGDNVSQCGELIDNCPLVPTSVFTRPLYPDMLILYATVEGAQSYRNTEKGSWLIQEFCRNLTAFGRTEDVTSLLTRTAKCVANCYHHVDKQKIVKQMPTFISTLRRKFYLTKSKDRNFTLTLIEENKKLLKIVKNLQEQMQNLSQTQNLKQN